MMRTLWFRVLTGGLLLALLGFGFWGVRLANARVQLAAPSQISPIHPTFALLDAAGDNVLDSGQPVSAMATCGQCHDAGFIAAHSFHADLGLRDYGAAGGSAPWDASNGLFGKFDPLTYRYLSQTGDERLDLSTADWLRVYGSRVAGGGPGVTGRAGEPLAGLLPDASNPEASILDALTGEAQPWDWAESGVLEMNCFVCHMADPNNQARVAEIEAGDFGQASIATLAATGIVEPAAAGWTYNLAAFDADGKLKPEYVRVQDPTNANCGACHGVVHSDLQTPLAFDACDLTALQTATTGQVIASQKINEAGVNLAGKAALTRSWDVHSERGLQCTDCHYALNNPAHAQAADEDRPQHLIYDPRRLEIGEFLERPDHNFARGQSAQYTVAPELKGTMRRCESCHDAVATHADWLPYASQHMEAVACESCHIPQLYAPAIQSYDWTVITPEGGPATACRGIEGGSTVDNLVTGYQPVLMQRTNVDGQRLLAPYNLVTSWFWTYIDDAGHQRPVRQVDLEAAYLQDGAYAPEILAAFDADGDGSLSGAELRLDTPAKEELVAARLTALGLQDVQIHGQVQPYSINHGVARGEWAVSDCRACHGEDSRVAASLVLASYTPGGVTPGFTGDTNVAASGEVETRDGTLSYRPTTSADDLYVFGYDRVRWVDWLGALVFAGTLLAVFAHATLRYVASLRHPHHLPEMRPEYLYAPYERLWHWLQTATIFILLWTGLIIHRPDIFGIFSFRHMVTVHNLMAAILVLNAALSLFWHLVSGEIRQFVPRPYGFFDDAIVQAKFYLSGIFRGDEHPFAKTRSKKLNPLQQATYFGLLNVLLPLQIVTGALMWGVQQWPQAAMWAGGLPMLAPIHSLVAWLFATFIVAHVYLTTTGETVFGDIQAMITGWGRVPTQPPAVAQSVDDTDVISSGAVSASD